MRFKKDRFKSIATRFLRPPFRGEALSTSIKAALLPVVFFFLGVMTSQLFFSPAPPLNKPENRLVARILSLFTPSNESIADQETEDESSQTASASDENEVANEEEIADFDMAPTGSAITANPQAYPGSSFTKDDILSDKDERIADIFHVPDELKARVGFWFDIYTRYGGNEHVIHHSDFPWIIFKVVDSTSANKAGANRWTNYHRARRLVDTQKKQVIASLQKLARSKKSTKLSAEDKRIAELLKDVPGSRAAVYARAAAVTRSQLGQKDFYTQGLVSSSQYLTDMEAIFARYDLPIEITRLPLVESSFNLRAVSKVGASGIWQFMPSTGKVKKLRVDDQFDERNSPLKATEAAAKLMRENIRILKHWPLAITAYNHGPGGLIRASKRYGTTDLAAIIKKNDSRSFGFASSNFYCEFLAALHAEKYQQEVFGEVPRHAPLAYEQLSLPVQLRAKTIANLAGLTLEELRLYNPDLGRRSIQQNLFVPKGYNLHLPPGRRDKLAGIKAQAKTLPPKITKSSKVKRAENAPKSKKTSKTSAVRVNKDKKLPKPAENKKLIVVDFEKPERSTVQKDETQSKSDFSTEDVAIRRAPITIEIDEDTVISPAPDESDEVELQQ